ncbi:hypothetical protein IAD21_03419 [Abditibacteriota bacterium]|nr:hypothetical protein IAD21_03419 [Abditibacteriota bacterium]
MKRAFTLVEALIVVAVIVVLAAFLWPVFATVREGPSGPTSHCNSNLKQIGLGLIVYAEDYGGKFPPAHIIPSAGWADSIYPYIKSPQTYQCDKASNGAVKPLTTDYFYNKRLSGLLSNKIKQPADVLLLGDGEDNAPTWNAWTRLPAAATTDFYSPSQRHRNGAIYGFADGHAKWIEPQYLGPIAKWNPLTP